MINKLFQGRQKLNGGKFRYYDNTNLINRVYVSRFNGSNFIKYFVT
jgi:hypothetical protein